MFIPRLHLKNGKEMVENFILIRGKMDEIEDLRKMLRNFFLLIFCFSLTLYFSGLAVVLLVHIFRLV